MKAMLLNKISNFNENITPLEMKDIPQPVPSNDEILVKISTCGVCHTELDEIEGRTPPTHFPVIPGHQVVGYVKEMGKNVTIHKIGDRVGIAWIYSACGECKFCLAGN